MTTFDELYAYAKEELVDAIRELHVTDTMGEDDDIRDRIDEIAHSNVPIYIGDIFAVFADGGICHIMNDSGLIEGCTDVLHIMRMRIYEALTECLYDDLADCVEAYAMGLNEYNEENEEA